MLGWTNRINLGQKIFNKMENVVPLIFSHQGKSSYGLGKYFQEFVQFF